MDSKFVALVRAAVVDVAVTLVAVRKIARVADVMEAPVVTAWTAVQCSYGDYSNGNCHNCLKGY